MRSKVGSSTASMLTVTRVEAGGLERRGEGVEQMAIGGNRQVERFAGDGAQAGQFPDQIDAARGAAAVRRR